MQDRGRSNHNHVNPDVHGIIQEDGIGQEEAKKE
jgi:hypothetical protein